jgi:hypothetical protein
MAITEEIFPNEPEILVPEYAARKEMTKVIREIQIYGNSYFYAPDTIGDPRSDIVNVVR